MKRFVVTGMLVCAFTLAIIIPAYSDQDRNRQRVEESKEAERLSMDKWKNKRADMEKRLDTMLIWKLGEDLDLSEETGAKVFPVVKKYEEKSREMFKKQKEIRKALRRALKEEQDDKLLGLLGELRQTTRETIELKGQEYDELKGIISNRQLAKYVLFRQNFRREIHNIITDSIQHDKGPSHRPRFNEEEGD